jgi:DNA-binding XRE family transcriptional regulator
MPDQHKSEQDFPVFLDHDWIALDFLAHLLERQWWRTGGEDVVDHGRKKLNGRRLIFGYGSAQRVVVFDQRAVIDQRDDCFIERQERHMPEAPLKLRPWTLAAIAAKHSLEDLRGRLVRLDTHGFLLVVGDPGRTALARKPRPVAGSVAGVPGVQALGATAPGCPTTAGANYFPLGASYNLTQNTKFTRPMNDSSRDAELIVLGRALRALRDHAGITQEELANRLGMDATYISRIERGRRGVQWLTVQRFLQALGASLHELADAIQEQRRTRRQR